MARRAKAGGPVEIIVSEMIYGGQGAFSDLILDGAWLYWVSSNELPSHYVGRIQRAGLAGGTVETLLSGVDFPGHVAIDATDLYWTHPTGTERMARCACGF